MLSMNIFTCQVAMFCYHCNMLKQGSPLIIFPLLIYSVLVAFPNNMLKEGYKITR